jgi:hypothetical protein
MVLLLGWRRRGGLLQSNRQAVGHGALAAAFEQRAALAAWCAADPGPTLDAAARCGSRLCGAARRALHRVRDTMQSCTHAGAQKLSSVRVL